MNAPVRVTEGWIELASGYRFDLDADDWPGLPLDDLIWGCARECRYNNQIAVDHYSVAEHSMLVGGAVRDMLAHPRPGGLVDRDVDLWNRTIRTAYAHDLAEGIMGDWPTPMKRHPEMGWLRDLEARLDRYLARRFDLIYPLPDIVKEVDLRILLNEVEAVRAPRDRADWGLPPDLRPLDCCGNIYGFRPRVAASMFKRDLALWGIE